MRGSWRKFPSYLALGLSVGQSVRTGSLIGQLQPRSRLHFASLKYNHDCLEFVTAENDSLHCWDYVVRASSNIDGVMLRPRSLS